MANLSRRGELGKVVPGEIIFRVLKEKWELGEEGRKGFVGIATGTEARRAFAPGATQGSLQLESALMWEWPKRWPEGTDSLKWCVARYFGAGVASKDATRQALPAVSGWRLPDQVKMLKSHSLLNPFKTHSKKQEESSGVGYHSGWRAGGMEGARA